jgi:peroxiredoxin Q/BCP
VSFDPPEANKAFKDGQSFPFDLLSDEDHAVATAYEAMRPPDDPRVNYANRVSYLIDPAGMIRRGYEVTDPAGHADVVLADLRELQS